MKLKLQTQSHLWWAAIQISIQFLALFELFEVWLSMRISEIIQRFGFLSGSLLSGFSLSNGYAVPDSLF